MTDPRCRISTRLQTSSTSSRKCVLKSPLRPARRARSRISASIWRWPAGSSPRVGSSRKMIEDVDQRAGHTQALPHAAAVDPDRRARHGRPIRHRPAGKTRSPPIPTRKTRRGGRNTGDTRRRSSAADTPCFREHTDAPPDLDRSGAGDAADGKVTAVRLDDRREDANGGRLARAIRAKQTDDLAGSCLEREIANRNPIPVRLGDTVNSRTAVEAGSATGASLEQLRSYPASVTTLGRHG